MSEKNASNEIQRLEDTIRKGERVISIGGLTSVASKAFVLSRLRTQTAKRFAVVTVSNEDADNWRSDLDFFSQQANDDARIALLPAFDSDPYSGVSPHAETQERRALALWQIANRTPDILVLPARSLIARTISPNEALQYGTVIRRDGDCDPDELVERLDSAGYVREDPIFNIGQFSVRGGIIDVWSPDAPDPVRIEFFGDTVDSIREFDPETQLSTGQLKEAAIAPMREFAASAEDLKEWALRAKKRFADDHLARNLKDRTDFAEYGEPFSGWEYLIPLVKPLASNVFEYLDDHVFVIDEPAIVEHSLTKFYADLEARYRHLDELGDIGLRPDELFVDADDLRHRIENAKLIELRALGKTAAETDNDFALPADTNGTAQQPNSPAPLFLFPPAASTVEFEIVSRPTRKFHGKFAEFASSIEPRIETYVILGSAGIAERFEEIIREYEAAIPPDHLRIGQLSSGFELSSMSVVYFTEIDIFGEMSDAGAAKPQSRRTKIRLGAFISDFRDLKPGDYVVHVDHGIGRFDGLQTISAQGAEREFMLLVYADDAKLFVPVERLDLVSRYSSGEAASPSIDRLGGLGWQKTKAKAKRAMRDMADELLRLYAERKLVPGHAFSPDAPWQHEFEDAFPFELTVDQAKAIDDVKEDMETPRPMDRLIIGDVGYGKTEVAMRAAFKAVMDGRQVAVLAPTTILAYQHFESFRKRFAAFPAKIDLLSRFRSTKEQRSVVETVKKGDVDVLIGTHRLLSNDVALPKLGLLVVDEEQRFGVAHKEKLKQLKKKVDVLTLSATPIPRTLNMSMLGMRDMSVIETPPRDRLAINTQVVQFSENVIRSAIDLELSRNGQIFFIHNRVETIEAIAALVQKIVPNARIAIGHGKMNEKEMEQVMLDFIDYKYDVLVATTIIENGIDIPRANTIIINRADNYGLSQLYQLRGRVGRSNRRAYAYLLIPSELELTPIARRRLSAIREFSDLGAGFRIAALDLELRGAGNILGGQQSGHLDALGFDLYTKMLERTIAEIRGEDIADEVSVSINLGIDVAIPKDYIVEASQRLRTYKRIASAESEEALLQIHAEIEDRYGRIPISVENLFAYGRLRKLAERIGIVSIDRAGGGFAIKLSDIAKVSPERLLRFVDGDPNASFSPSGILRIAETDDNLIHAAGEVLGAIRS
jgi:transcription-repair coupling factor (superfamily II helicase)